MDVIADGIGAIYAGYYYDIETASYYVGGVVAVGVSGAIFRQLVTRGKRIARVSGEFRIIDNVARLANGSLSKTNLLEVAWKNNIVGHLSGVNYSATKTVNGRSVTVKYDEYGFPEFKEFSPGEHTFIRSDNYTGVYESDNLIANEGLIKELGEDNVWFNPAGNGSPVSIKIDGKWEEFTWHHLQDGKTMIPVKQDVHSSFSHSGGKQAIDSGLKGFFEY